MQPGLSVPCARVAGYVGGRQQPDQAVDDRDLRDDERRTEEVAATPCVGKKGLGGLEEDDEEQDREVEPGRDAPQLVRELEAEDLPELHCVTLRLRSGQAAAPAARRAGRCARSSH